MGKLNFRITSSKWLESFKASQTFALNQMARGDKQFQISSQELLLDLYDRWFHWLVSTEQLLGKAGRLGDTERRELIREAVNLLACSKQEWMQDDLIEAKLKTLWLSAYQPAHEAYVAHLRKLEGCDAGSAFAQIAERLLGLLQHCLFTLHEVDSILHKPQERAFISVDDYDCTVYNQQGRDLLTERLRLYQRECLAVRGTTESWHIKRYADGAMASGLLSQLENHLQLARP